VSAPREEPIAACLFPTAALSEGDETRRLADIVDRALEQNLQRLEIRILPESEWRSAAAGIPPESLLNGRIAAEAAERAGARMAVVSMVHLDGRQLSMDVKVLDSRSGRLVSAVYAVTLVGVAVHNRVAEAVDRLTPQLESFISPEQQAEDVAPFVLEATLLSDLDGTRVSLGGVEPAGEVSGGRLTLPFAPYPVGTRLELVMQKDGYHTASETIVLDRTRSEVRLRPLWRETRRSLYVSLTTGQLLGLGVGYRHYLEPDTLFVAGENYFYVQPARSDAGGVAVHDDLAALVGRYLFWRYDAPFRFALAAGAGVILTKADVPGLFTDWYLDLLSVNLEWNKKEYTITLRGDAKATLGIGNNLLGADIMTMNRFGPQLTLSIGRRL
jgi:hypothetical protein